MNRKYAIFEGGVYIKIYTIHIIIFIRTCVYIYLIIYIRIYIYMHVFDVNIYIMLPCLYDKMARYGTVSCTWHQNHKAPA